MRDTKRTADVFEPLVPTVPELVRMYEELGGSLSRDITFGHDPLAAIEHAYQSRRRIFHTTQPTGNELFANIINNNIETTRTALEYNIDLTMHLFDEFGE